MIHVYIGDGKGKTTAAIGLSVRAAGRGLAVAVAQFLKSGATGELSSLEKLGVPVIRSELQLGFTFQMDEETKKRCRQEQTHILERLRAETADVMVLDEVIDALNTGMLDEAEFRLFTEACKAELILTGRNPPAWLVEKADYVSEVRKIKHPYDRGICARIGIEK
ncbi:MAG: cob(I)yrinic acid a,c-diamide adenosyltransferase [Spirochaetaceae bacterium]|jgi:cob(I)alamin adenosyltransferase|nr:cob(I)yrinic acid a,c-diamide adenosyltransferase [Spirochaetaceae bacterium]